jgi:two-component system sensor histidine kinase TctE
VRIVTEVVQDCLPRAMDKHIDLGYDGAEPAARRLAQRQCHAAAELVRNLVDNAINYTPSTSEQPGVVTVRVQADHFGQVLLLQVEDSGPACPRPSASWSSSPSTARWARGRRLGPGPAHRAEIARQHGAQVLLDDAHRASAAGRTLHRALQGMLAAAA